MRRGEASLAEIAHALAEADPMTLCLSPDVRWLSPRRGGATRRRVCGTVARRTRRSGAPDRGNILRRKGEALTAVAARVLEQNELSGPRKPVRCFSAGAGSAGTAVGISTCIAGCLLGRHRRDGRLDRPVAGGDLRRALPTTVWLASPRSLEYPRNWNCKT